MLLQLTLKNKDLVFRLDKKHGHKDRAITNFFLILCSSVTIHDRGFMRLYKGL